MTVEQVFAAGRVRRWHSHPEMSHTEDYNDAHQGRVARLILALHPSPSALLIAAALTHDDGESGPGDMSRQAKRANPELRAMLQELEDAKICQIWNTPIPPRMSLNPDEIAWLKFCDLLDGYMWVKHKNPNILAQPGWIANRNELAEFAKSQHIIHLIKTIGLA
ncbi:hypothetical protein HUU40_00295 [candidate division KSB1 bacterium]|nr:hypothetical protein [candidate division KSB1 bacterium]